MHLLVLLCFIHRLGSLQVVTHGMEAVMFKLFIKIFLFYFVIVIVISYLVFAFPYFAHTYTEIVSKS